MNGFLHDLRFGLRQLAAKPGFAAAAIITLALGIGANTAVFSVLNGYLLKPLPYPQAQQLVAINESAPAAGQMYAGVSIADFLDIQAGVSAVSAVALYHTDARNFRANGRTRRIMTLVARSSLFDVLRVRPVIGHAFSAQNEQKGRNHVAVLSYAFWQHTFNGNRSAVGRSVELDGEQYRVIGVMPKGFAFPDNQVSLWVPYYFPPFPPGSKTKCRTCWGNKRVIGRLKPGASIEQVRAQLSQVREHIASSVIPLLANWYRDKHWALKARQYRNVLLGDRTPLLLILQGFVLLVLLMACVNVANLLLARILGRMHEIAMRTALGASRWTLIRQMLVEGLCLAVPGALAGVALGWFSLTYIQNAGLGAQLGVFTLTPDWRVGLFALGMVLLVAVVTSVLPIRQLSRNDPQALLQSGGRAVGGGHGARRTRTALVVAEIALAAALLGGAGLLVHSLARLQAVDPGFSTRNVLTADILVSTTGKPDAAAIAQYYDQLLRNVRRVPGVEEAALTSSVPIERPPYGNGYTVPGRVELSDPRSPVGDMSLVTAGFFRALNISLLRGRTFNDQDRFGGQPVAVVDEKLANTWFPGESPIGHEITVGGISNENGRVHFKIVGEVATIRSESLEKSPDRGGFYISRIQFPFIAGTSLAVKTSVPPRTLIDPIKQAVNGINPLVSISNFTTMDEAVAQSLAEREAVMALVLVFACLGLVLAAVGVYGVLSYVVGQRVTECGVRLALGALPGDLLWLIIRDGLKMLVMGLCAGLLLAVVLGYSISSQLFNVAPFDPVTLAGVAVALSIITVAACYLPARRAAKLDPAVAILEQ
ncbi:MAG TPA: ABC transporter permease [Gammaproteobacteria bacterium]|nr:ABC transporter permease [Gammaproteobacteria bacterium]